MLQHIMGYIKKQDRLVIVEQYRQEHVTLIVPVTLCAKIHTFLLGITGLFIPASCCVEVAQSCIKTRLFQ